MSGLRSFLIVLLVVLSVAALTSGRTLSAKNALNELATAIPLVNHGGPVVWNPISFYFFYYGDFSNPATHDYYTPGLLRQFITDATGTSYLNVAAQYTDRAGHNVTTDISYQGHTFITGYPDGKVLQNDSSNCFDVLIKKYIKNYKVPLNQNTQYYIIYSSDVTYVTDDGPCETGEVACGYHKNFQDPTTSKTYLWGQVGSNENLCGVPTGPYTSATNSVLDVFSHEMFETLTDPLGSTWFDSANPGQEIGDKCNFYFGTNQQDSTIAPGKKYNLKLNGHEYLVQLEWDNSVLGCSLTKGSVSAPSPSASGSKAASGASASNSALALPSAQASVSTGSSPSNSPAVASSRAANPSNSPAASLNATKGACITCPSTGCKKVRQVGRVCTKTLGGTFSTANGKACCSNLAHTTWNFHWTVDLVPNCVYSVPYTKQAALCVALGGVVGCDDTSSAGVRLTCTR